MPRSIARIRPKSGPPSFGHSSRGSAFPPSRSVPVTSGWLRAGLPLLVAGITFAVFVIVVIRALRMKKDKIDHMAHLPLENDHHSSSNRNH